jgi:hypothetical protein
MKIGRQQTRDRREDRFERAEKFAEPMETLPGKTLRDRSPAARKTPQPSTHPRVGVAGAVASTMPVVRSAAASPEPKVRLTRFSLHAPQAKSVQVAGTFNHWNPGATPLSKRNDGSWQSEISLGPGTYQYKFIVDGVWQEDPLASDSIENPFGSRNSIKHLD